MLREGELGVHPPGALGVAFFVHASAECFVGRGGDGITQPLKDLGALTLDDHGRPRTIPLRDRIYANLLEADALERLPELLMVCCNPDQLGLFTAEMTRFLESMCERGRLRTKEDICREVPILLVLPNGILSELTIDTYTEQLQESILMERLPGITDDLRDALVDRVVRGVSLQAGGRRGSGAQTIYVLERKGAVVFAGGGDAERERIEAILTSHDYPFTHPRGVPGTRIEFDKAMISIVLNVGGLIHTVTADGELIDLRMGDLCKDPGKADFVHDITRAVFDVGQAVGAYPPEATYDDIWAGHRATILAHAGHVTSSLKTFRDALGGGLCGVRLFSNEEWILTPLCRYAANAGLKEEEELFQSLKRRVQESMAKAIRRREKSGPGGSGRLRASKMNLTGQRNFNIELYEDGSDEMLLIGTMLDSEHLIKLELTLYLPDEQITRSRLELVRVPFPVCRELEQIADRLVGLRIERGVLNKLAHRVGGQVGCSHIKELAANLVYFAASTLVRYRVGIDPTTTDYEHTTPEERFKLTKELLNDTCLAYSQTTALGLDEQIGIKKIGEEHTHPVPLGDYEPSFGVLLKERAERWGDKVYLRYRGDRKDYAISWKEFARRTFQIARHLIEQGVHKGDRIGMISENRAEMYMFETAAMSIGAITVPVFAGYATPQVAYVLGHAKPRFVVVSGVHQLEKIERDKHPWIERYYCMDFNKASQRWGALDFAMLLSDGGADEPELQARIEAVEPTSLCLIMYTSGTTGAPKGVLLGHQQLISQQKAMSLMWDVGENDVYMNWLPWHHSFGGLFERFMSLYNGAELCLDDSRGKDIKGLIENWKAFRPTIFFSVPRVHDLLIKECEQDPETEKAIFGDRLRFVLTAGAALPAHVEAAYRKQGIPVLEAWGLTETSPCVTATTKDGTWKSGYVGIPLPGVSVRIDSEQEILVKGPNVMEGYLDDEENTSHVISQDGWLRTGDLGEFTKDGLRVFGRKDGTFKLTTGEKVQPQRVESVLVNESSFINGVVVVGSGMDYVGALIYPNLSELSSWAVGKGVPSNKLLTHPAVIELFASELGRINPLVEIRYQRVKRAILADHDPTLDNGELTSSGKLVRKSVLKNFKEKINELFALQPSADVIEVQQQTQRTVASEA
ncbi:MAG: AMP-binding protein [Phycisphaerales bacterium]|nr:MAG: AMP-binding protein [Phycisphaerales bacterium]